MNKFMAFVVFSMGVPALAATYTVQADSSSAAIQEIVDAAHDNNLFQVGNGPESCGAGWGSAGRMISVAEAFTYATITVSYFSGTDTWAGPVDDVNHTVDYQDGASNK